MLGVLGSSCALGPKFFCVVLAFESSRLKGWGGVCLCDSHAFFRIFCPFSLDIESRLQCVDMACPGPFYLPF